MVQLMRRRGDEQGIVLVLVALSIVVVMIFVAFAVDLGNARQQRRQAQNAADAAALAAAQDLADVTNSGRMTTAESTAKGYVTKVYGSSLDSLWSGCADPSHLAAQAADTQCISFNSSSNPTQVRVHLPDDVIKSSFGQFANTSSIAVNASAVAGVFSPLTGRILPLAIQAAEGDGLKCVENSGSDQGCSNRNTGNFGDLQSPRLVLFTGAGNTSDTLRVNYAIGLDHGLIQYQPGFTGYPTRICDGSLTSPCTTNNAGASATANHLNTATGNSTDEPTDGLVTGFSAAGQTFCGRLERVDFTDTNAGQPMPTPPGSCSTGPGPTIDVLGHTVDGRHIAYWMNDPSPFYKTGCSGNPCVNPTSDPADSSAYATGDTALECFIRKYQRGTALPTITDCPTMRPNNPATLPIFKHDIINDPRFGYIPIVASWPSGGSTAATIVGFKAAFVYNLYTTNTKLKALDAWVFDPTLIDNADFTGGSTFDFQGGPATILLLK